MKHFKTLDDIKPAGKRILLRVDLNSAVINGKIELSDRIVAHAGTIKELTRKKARVIILAHQGRKNQDDFTSLRQHAKLLNKFVKVKFVDDIIGKKAVNAINQLKNGEALLLENLRFLEEETNPGKNNKLVRILSKNSDYYVNDAFSVSHRDQASITGFPRIMKSFIGRVMERELEGANKIKKGKLLMILGGVKPEEHIELIKSRMNAEILTTGVFSMLVAKASGYKFGKQDEHLKEHWNKLGNELKKIIDKADIHIPVDYAIEKDNGRVEIDIDEFPNNHFVYDIGERTVMRYSKKIIHARNLIMKGPAGKYEDKKWIDGTRGLFNAILKCKGFTIIAGGNTISAMKHLNISKDKVKHVSLSGGAFIEYIAGKKLPGLEALKKRQ